MLGCGLALKDSAWSRKVVPGPPCAARHYGSRKALTMKKLLILLIVFSVSCATAGEASKNKGTAAPKSNKEKEVDPTKVTLDIRHGIELPWGKPGFSILVSNWAPNGEMSVHAIGPDGERIDLVPTKSPLKADHNGDMIIDIDYERKGLRQGHWIMVVAGIPGFHMIQTDIPFVEPPTKERKTWKLIFGKTPKPDGPGKKGQ